VWLSTAGEHQEGSGIVLLSGQVARQDLRRHKGLEKLWR